MDVREKLVEMSEQLRYCADVSDCANCKRWDNVCENQCVDNLLLMAADLIDEVANGVTVQEWISVKDRLPEKETEVLILASRKIYSLKSHSHTTHHIITTGMYEDGTKRTEDSDWLWEADGFEYDEERDDYIIPDGWWEYKHYNGDEQHNYSVDDEVTHWMPLPQPPKGE